MPNGILSRLSFIKDSIFSNQVLFNSALQQLFDERELTVFKDDIYRSCHLQRNASHIRVIEPDTKGNLWVGYDNAGLSYFNPHTNHLIKFDNELESAKMEKQRIGALLADTDVLWIGFLNGFL